jgi:capsule polysaccharide export protein KpsE/RkpR
MKKLENISDVINDLNRDEDSPKEYNTVQEIVNEIVERGNSEHVYAFHDDHLGLESDLGSDFLNLKIVDINTDKNEEKIDMIVDQANTISNYYNREITEDIQDEIDEDKMTRGIK